MNQRETIPWAGGTELHGMGFALNMPYDVYVDIIDDVDGSSAHHFLLRDDMFGQAEAEKLAEDYVQLMYAVAKEPEAMIGRIELASDGR